MYVYQNLLWCGFQIQEGKSFSKIKEPEILVLEGIVSAWFIILNAFKKKNTPKKPTKNLNNKIHFW